MNGNKNKQPAVYTGNKVKMASYEQTFLEQLTNIHGVDFTTWQGWEQLMGWIKRQPWREEFFGGEKIPARLLYPQTLSEELTRYLGG
jgi:hypothetical protein